MSQWSELLSSLAIWPGLFLLAGGLAKARDDGFGDTVLARVVPGFVPPRAVAAIELVVGATVLIGVFPPVPAAAAALVLAVAGGVAVWGVRHAPDAGCGCFGQRSEPVSPRTAVRAGVLSALALVAALGGGPWWDVSPAGALLTLAAGALVLALTPELRSRETQLRAQEAVCSHRPVSPQRTLARLRRSPLWTDARQYLAADAPSEEWRDGCWRYLTYPASYEGEAATAVFALYLGRNRSADGVAFVAAGEERVLGQIKGRK